MNHKIRIATFFDWTLRWPCQCNACTEYGGLAVIYSRLESLQRPRFSFFPFLRGILSYLWIAVGIAKAKARLKQ